MNEFGETPSIYVWPAGHEEGESYGEDFWERVTKGLKSVGIEWETV
jgi:hypothetical protein